MSDLKEDGPLPVPETKFDPNWAVKIEKAKEARESGRQGRVGMPPVFRTR